MAFFDLVLKQGDFREQQDKCQDKIIINRQNNNLQKCGPGL